MSHPLLRPSNATRAFACPASLDREAAVADRFPSDSDAAESGRRVHEEIARQLLNWKPTHELSLSVEESRLVDMCVKYVLGVNGMVTGIETKIPCPGFERGGTIDTYLLRPTQLIDVFELIVIDYKTGRLVPEYDAAHDLQTWGYCVGAYRKLTREGYTISTVMGKRFHPRLWDENRESSVEFDPALMDTYEQQLNSVANFISENRNLARPGDMQCMYCRAKTVCPEYQEQAQRMEFPAAKLDSMDVISPEQLAAILGQRKRLATYNNMMDDAVNLARAVIEAGGSVPGYKLTEGRKRRSVEDTGAARSVLTTPCDEHFALPAPSLDACSEISFAKLVKAARVAWGMTEKEAELRLIAALGDLYNEKRDKPSVVPVKQEKSE